MVMANAGSSSRNEDGCSSQPQQSALPVYLQPKPAVLKPELSRRVDHARLRAILERKRFEISDFEVNLASNSNKVGVDFSSLKGILGRSAVPSLEVNRAVGAVDHARFRADHARLKAVLAGSSSGSEINFLGRKSHTGPQPADSDQVLVLRKERSLQSLLIRFTDLSKCFLDEIAGLGGTQVGESVSSLVKSMVCKSSLHLEQVNGALKDMQSGKVNIVAAGGEQGDRDGVEALANQEKRRLEAAKLSLEADKVRLETDKVRLEADNMRLEGDKRRLQAEVEAANTAAATYLRRIEDEASCLICMTNPRNVVLLPCFHGHYCNECIERHRKTNKNCPSCRAVIKVTIPFIP